MENISGKSRASFRWMLSIVTIRIAVIVSPCFAADLGASQGMQRLGTAPAEIMPFRCDSLDPKVCFDIYWRLRNEPAQAEGGEVGYDYTLRPILFVAPRGDTAFQEARRTPRRCAPVSPPAIAAYFSLVRCAMWRCASRSLRIPPTWCPPYGKSSIRPRSGT
jgi:hypothetical protein